MKRHSVKSWREVDPRTAAVYAAIAALLLVVCVVLPASGWFTVPRLAPVAQAGTIEGMVTNLLSQQTQQTSEGPQTLQRLAVRLDGGPHQGQSLTIQHTETATGGLHVRAGDRVLLTPTSAGAASESSYYIADHVRTGTLAWLAVLFVGLVVLVAGVAGARSLLSLAASLLIIVRFILPAILSGANPLLVSLLGALVIMVVTLYVAHGVTLKTTVALGGTALGLLLTGLLALLAIQAARLTGLGTEEAVQVQRLANGAIDVRGLLLGGIVLGTLGLVNDVTVGQAAAVFELRRADRTLGHADLYRRAMNVGRDHIGSMVYTLTLAYAGAALPLLVLFAANTEPLNVLVNREYLSAEIVRTLVGSIGIVACVPLTTLLGVLAATGWRAPSTRAGTTPGGQ